MEQTETRAEAKKSKEEAKKKQKGREGKERRRERVKGGTRRENFCNKKSDANDSGNAHNKKIKRLGNVKKNLAYMGNDRITKLRNSETNERIPSETITIA